MRRKLILFLIVLLVACATVRAAMTNSSAVILTRPTYITSQSSLLNPLYLWANEAEDILEGTTGFTGSTLYVVPQSATPSANEGRLYYDSDTDILYYYANGAWVGCGAGTFAGGSITSAITMSNGIVMRSSTTTAQTSGIQVYDNDTGPAYVNAFGITNGNTPAIVIGSATTSLAVTSTGLNVTTAGAVTGVTSIVTSGAVTAGTTLASTTTLTAGGNLILESGETISNSINTEFTFSDGSEDLTFDMDSASNAVGLKSSTGVDELAMGAVDDLSGVGTITFDAAAASMSTATSGDAQDLTLSVTGATNSSLILASSGTGADALTISTSAGGMDITVAGAAANEDLDLLSNASINITATEADAAAITLVSTGGVDISASATYDIDVTATGGTVQVIASEAAANQFKVDAQGIVAGNAIVLETTDGGVEVNADGAANGDVTVSAEDDISVTAVDDLTLNGGSAGSIINLGTNTQGNVIHIGDNDTTADSITIGSAKDTSALAGIAVTVGSIGTTSATIIQSGTGDLALTSTDQISLTVNTAVTDNIVVTNTQSTDVDAISLIATAGGINVDAAAGKIIDIDGGTIQIDNKTAGAGAIAITANQGATDTITITNTQGNTAAAITLTSTAGGITLVSSTGVTTGDPIAGDGTAAWYGGLKAITNDAEPHAITAAESGKVLTNLGSNGADAWTLPTAVAGYEYTFVVMAAQGMQITPAAGDSILGSGIDVAAGDTYTADAVGETLHIVAVDATNWIILSSTGTWTDSVP